MLSHPGSRVVFVKEGKPVELPRRFVRVVWDEGFGWPECTRRERTARNFATEHNAGRQVAAIEALPSHHVLVGVYVSDLHWSEIDADSLPRPEGDTDG